jgi:DNA-directed RNA polymerase specialized sigma24 family protein
METRASFSQITAPDPKKYAQRFLNFRLQAKDHALLEQLSKDQREMLLSEGSYKDKAARFGVALGTVRSRMHRARAALEALRLEKSQDPAAISS